MATWVPPAHSCTPGTLADNNRLKQAGEVLSAFDVLMGAHRGEVHCTITSAVVCPSLDPNTSCTDPSDLPLVCVFGVTHVHAQALDGTSLASLKTSLQGFIKKDQVLKVDTKVCPCPNAPCTCALVVLSCSSGHVLLSARLLLRALMLLSPLEPHVVTETQVDPSIIGGLVVNIGDKYIEMSIGTNIKKISDVLAQPL